MPIIASDNGSGSNFEPVEAGLYAARCYSMIYMGTIEENINGTVKQLSKVRLGFELPTELKVFKEENGEQPYVLSKDFTLSMNEKATLRKFLESWRGQPFTEEQCKAFDITVLLGVPCMLNVIHKEGKTGGKKYAEISAITPPMKGLSIPSQINPTFEFNVCEFDQSKFDKIPEFIQKKIKSSAEYVQMQSALKQEEAKEFSPLDPEPALSENDKDDLPF